MLPPVETKRALIVVRTYPVPARQGVEVSCTAAITDKGEWLRLFPVPYRRLPEDKRFKKYQWIELDVEKASDARPESYKIDPNSIKILSEPLSTKQDWQTRKSAIFPLKSHCLCCIQKQRDMDGHPTLGIFKPKKIKRLTITPEDSQWSPVQLANLKQLDLFYDPPKEELEKIPFAFRYEFTCDDDECAGHAMICTDWEMGQSYRQWSRDYGSDWEAKFRQRYETEMISKFDTHFYVGTVHRYPNTWIIVGLFYPPKTQQITLF